MRGSKRKTSGSTCWGRTLLMAVRTVEYDTIYEQNTKPKQSRCSSSVGQGGVCQHGAGCRGTARSGPSPAACHHREGWGTDPAQIQTDVFR